MPRYVGELMGRGEPGKLRSLVVWSWRIELVAAVVGAGVLVAVAAAGATPRAAWALGAVVVFAGVLHKVPGSLLLGAQRWRQNGIVVLTTTTASAVATVVVLLLGGGITGMFAVLAAANVVMLLWGTVLARHLFGGASKARQPLGRLGREIVRFGMIASVPIVLGFIVSQRSEFFFLEHYSTNTQIALYSIAFSAYLAIVAAPIAIGNMIAPAVGALHGAGESRRIRSGYARGLRLLLLVTIPLTVAAVVFGPALIRLLYGNQYRGAGTIVLILLAPLPIVPLAGLSSGVLVGLARIGFPVAVSIVGVVVDLGLAALLVPHLAASGAAIANIAAQIGKAILVIWYSVRLVGGVDLAPRHLVKAAAAAVVGGRLRTARPRNGRVCLAVRTRRRHRRLDLHGPCVPAPRAAPGRRGLADERAWQPDSEPCDSHLRSEPGRRSERHLRAGRREPRITAVRSAMRDAIVRRPKQIARGVVERLLELSIERRRTDDKTSPATKIAQRTLFLEYRKRVVAGEPLPKASETGFRLSPSSTRTASSSSFSASQAAPRDGSSTLAPATVCMPATAQTSP